MIEPDKRGWSFGNRALNERAMEDYQKIIKQIGRGNLCFNKAYWTPDDKSGVSLYGVSVRKYLIGIHQNKNGEVITKYPESFLDHLMIDPNNPYIWQRPLKPNHFFWVLVALPNGKFWYQLPKDLQAAMYQYEKGKPKNWWKILCGCYINVPIGRYHDHKAPLVTGKILKVSRRKKHIHDPRWITRSQFIRPKVTRYGFEHVTANKYQFMRHDYSNDNRSKISQSLHIAVLRHNLRNVFNWHNLKLLIEILLLTAGCCFTIEVAVRAIQSLGKVF